MTDFKSKNFPRALREFARVTTDADYNRAMFMLGNIGTVFDNRVHETMRMMRNAENLICAYKLEQADKLNKKFETRAQAMRVCAAWRKSVDNFFTLRARRAKANCK